MKIRLGLKVRHSKNICFDRSTIIIFIALIGKWHREVNVLKHTAAAGGALTYSHALASEGFWKRIYNCMATCRVNSFVGRMEVMSEILRKARRT